jgi:hypothetical protein
MSANDVSPLVLQNLRKSSTAMVFPSFNPIFPERGVNGLAAETANQKRSSSARVKVCAIPVEALDTLVECRRSKSTTSTALTQKTPQRQPSQKWLACVRFSSRALAETNSICATTRTVILAVKDRTSAL